MPARASLVGAGTTGEIWEIDEATATTALLGDTGLGQLTSLALDASGTYYATSFPPPATGSPALITIDPVTGSGQFVANLDLGGEVVVPLALAFDSSSDTLYLSNRPSLTVGPTDLWTVDVDTGVGTFVGPLALGGAAGAIFSMDVAEDGTLFGWDLGPASGPDDGAGLVTIDPLTGAMTDVNPAFGTGGANILSIVFQGDGALYGATDSLFSIDRVTGVATEIGSLEETIFIAGLEVLVSVPEPSSGMLVGLALVGVASVRSRSSRRAS